MNTIPATGPKKAPFNKVFKRNIDSPSMDVKNANAVIRKPETRAKETEKRITMDATQIIF